jgi:hypothetical protein
MSPPRNASECEALTTDTHTTVSDAPAPPPSRDKKDNLLCTGCGKRFADHEPAFVESVPKRGAYRIRPSERWSAYVAAPRCKPCTDRKEREEHEKNVRDYPTLYGDKAFTPTLWERGTSAPLPAALPHRCRGCKRLLRGRRRRYGAMWRECDAFCSRLYFRPRNAERMRVVRARERAAWRPDPCKQCGQPVGREGARYCSPRCRLKAWRGHRK